MVIMDSSVKTGYVPRFSSRDLESKRGRRPDGAVSYLYDDPLELAINVALAAERPLLLSGPPGCGKSTMAADVAWKLGRRFHAQVITSRTQAQDLQWTVDVVGRLSLATAGIDTRDQHPFVKPGVLWRAFDPESAAKHGGAAPERPWQDTGRHAVVLLDEMDKAEPDVPNDLLDVLDQNEFFVRETGTLVQPAQDLDVLVVITTNGERDLPPAFLRRCVCHEIKIPESADHDERLKGIARKHFEISQISDPLLTSVIGLYGALRRDASSRKLRAPSTAELIDALKACESLGIRDASEPQWKSIVTVAMWKHASQPPAGDHSAGAGPARPPVSGGAV
jgi:MoxR-like ATPase